MHSFQPSRGRIFFEVLCALGIVASCVGAWKQTGASALLLAAAIAGLYGFVRLFDLARRKPAMAEEPQRITFEPEVAAAPLIDVPFAVPEPQLATELSIEEPVIAEPVAPASSSGRRSGGSRKGSGRRAKPRKEPKVVAPVAADQAVVPWPVAEEADAPELAQASGDDFAFLAEEDGAHAHIAPLFEPAPYVHVRQQRAAFGRKAR